MNTQKFIYRCEVCGRTEILTPDEAYQAGWDYPPFMGTFGIVSPRTCPDCPMMETAWAAITLHEVQYEDLSERHKQAIQQILGEPYDMMLPDNM